MQILDETLDLNKSKQYKLSILIQKGGLSFIILDSKVDKVIAYKYTEIDKFDNQKECCYFMNKILNQEELIKSEYAKVEIIYETLKSISIPEIFYSDKDKKDFFKLNLELEDDEIILDNEIKSIATKKLFAVPNPILDVINEHFSNVRILHQTTPIIQKYLEVYEHHHQKV